MANVLGNYNPTFFAQETLIWLSNQLGMAQRVHRGFELERNAFKLGDVVQIKRPSTFTAENFVKGVGTTSQDVIGLNESITLDTHKEVKFTLDDQDLVKTSEKIIEDHIGPAANAIADAVDTFLYNLVQDNVGSLVDVSGAGSTISQFFTLVKKRMRTNQVPLSDIENIHYMVDEELEATLLDAGIFHEARITGGAENQAALINGTLGRRFGFNIFPSQNANLSLAQQTGTLAAAAGGGDELGAVDGAHAANSTTLVVDNLTNLETFSDNVDRFTIAGDPTVYTVKVGPDVAGAQSSLTIFPGLRKNFAGGEVVTFENRTTEEDAAAGSIQNIAFHRNAIGLIMAPLPTIGDGKGAQIAVATDPRSGLSVRARMFYEGNAQELSVAVDALFGGTMLDSQLAVKTNRAAS